MNPTQARAFKEYEGKTSKYKAEGSAQADNGEYFAEADIGDLFRAVKQAETEEEERWVEEVH